MSLSTYPIPSTADGVWTHWRGICSWLFKESLGGEGGWLAERFPLGAAKNGISVHIAVYRFLMGATINPPQIRILK